MAKGKWLRRPLLLIALLAGWAHGDFNDGELRQVATLIEQGKARLALAQVDALLVRNSEDPRPLFLKARAHERAGHPEKAIDIYQRLIRDYPSSPEPFINLSVIYASQEQFDNARELLLQALETSPLYAKVYQNLVDLHAAMASRAYKSALSLPGKSAKPALVAQSTMDSWSSTIAPLTLPEPVPEPEPAPQSAHIGSTGEQVVEPAPPISEPVTVSRHVKAQANNGKPRVAALTAPGQIEVQDPPVADDKKKLEALVRNWADAWSRRDVDQYLSFYGDQFMPHSGLSRRQWTKQRRQRITSKKNIDIALNDFRFDIGGHSATVVFRQDYRSDTFADVVHKRLTFKRDSDDWKIVREAVDR